MTICIYTLYNVTHMLKIISRLLICYRAQTTLLLITYQIPCDVPFLQCYPAELQGIPFKFNTYDVRNSCHAISLHGL